MSDKPFCSYNELIIKLRDEKKLSIPPEDEPEVIKLLKQHSYFGLISGYKPLFKDKDGNYKSGTTIHDIFALYSFDNKLRDIFFRSILIIEKHIKSLLSYSFAEKRGDAQSAYCDPHNYDYIRFNPQDTYKRVTEVDKLTKLLSKMTRPPFEHEYIRHQWEMHHNIPLWVILKAATLGTASKMYSLCKADVQTDISKEFPGVTEGMLVGMLDLLTLLRNVCAHNERVYDFNISGRRAIQSTKIHRQLMIPCTNGRYSSGQKDLFAALICFKYLLQQDTFAEVVNNISLALDMLQRDTKAIPPNQILSRMGFPGNWKDIKAAAKE